jgi:hypothetical protein
MRSLIKGYGREKKVGMMMMKMVVIVFMNNIHADTPFNKTQR